MPLRVKANILTTFVATKSEEIAENVEETAEDLKQTADKRSLRSKRDSSWNIFASLVHYLTHFSLEKPILSLSVCRTIRRDAVTKLVPDHNVFDASFAAKCCKRERVQVRKRIDP